MVGLIAGRAEAFNTNGLVTHGISGDKQLCAHTYSLIIPIDGLIISIFPAIITVPFEAAFGHGTHLSLGEIFVLCVPLITLSYAFLMAFYMLLKEQIKTMSILLLLGTAQLALSFAQWGLIA